MDQPTQETPAAAPSSPTPAAPQSQKSEDTAPRISPSPLPRKPKQDRPPEDDPGIWHMSRRNLLSVVGWMGFLGFIVASTVGALRYMFPRVLFEPPTKFKAGFPQDYVVGEVSEKYKDSQRVWIVREKTGFYAIIAICTHLGCTPRWLPAENKFKCPCHGSGYYKSGVNFEGPAPRPMERAFIGLADDGEIEVDRSIKFRYEENQWGNPGSYLPYSG